MIATEALLRWNRPGCGLQAAASRDVHHDQFIPRLNAAPHGSGLHPHRLTLELTETAVMMNASATAAAALQKISELSIRLAIDDFGTGYWSINHLRRFPARALKIDQSLCANIEQDAAPSSVMSALVVMGHTLGDNGPGRDAVCGTLTPAALAPDARLKSALAGADDRSRAVTTARSRGRATRPAAASSRTRRKAESPSRAARHPVWYVAALEDVMALLSECIHA